MCGVAIVAASYLVAAFANASPVTQPSFAGASLRTPVVVTGPGTEADSPAEEGGPVRAESPDDRGREFQSVAHTPLQVI
jgi:hypothetical protein